MESLIGESTLRYLKAIPTLLRTCLIGLLEWIMPEYWCAKAVDQDIVLITGAGSGLGRAIALEYARLGSSLVLWDINEKGLQETRGLVRDVYEKKIKSSEINDASEKICLTYRADVSDRAEVYRLAAQVNAELNIGKRAHEPERYISVLVNNAGIYHGLLLQDLKDEQIERIFKINILAHFWTVRAFLPNMIKHKNGHIVEIASMGGISGLLKQVDYCATKFATVGFEESLSIELDYLGLADKIRTTAICPFFFSSNLFTGFNTSIASLMSPEFVAKETVRAMRCNHSRVLLPKLRGYALNFIRTFMTRKTIIEMTRALGIAEGIKEIKGHAAVVEAAS